MPERTVYDQYKEMVEKTKQLHSELVELSSKVDGMVISMDAEMAGPVASSQNVSIHDSDVNTSSNVDKSGNNSLGRRVSSVEKY